MVEAIAERHPQVSVFDIQNIVTETFAVMVEALADGQPIYLRGFGTFTPKLFAEKIGRNIGKGEAIVIPAHYVVKFKPGANLKKAVSFLD